MKLNYFIASIVLALSLFTSSEGSSPSNPYGDGKLKVTSEDRESNKYTISVSIGVDRRDDFISSLNRFARKKGVSTRINVEDGEYISVITLTFEGEDSSVRKIISKIKKKEKKN